MMRIQIRAALFVMVLLIVQAAGTRAAEIDGGFHLTGVVSSSSGRSALINRRVVQAGDHVDGAEVLAIHDSFVVVTRGGRDLVLRMGSRAQSFEEGSIASGAAAPQGEDPRIGVGKSPEHRPRRVTRVANRDRGIDRPVRHDARSDAPSKVRHHSRHEVHRVAPGETLFEIAGRYFDYEDGRLKQAMLWLYEANPASFGSSMNVLFEGALLRVPDVDQLELVSPSVARAEVDRHVELWKRTRARARDTPEIASVTRPSSEATVYGPVSPGETLSAIAARERPEGSSLDQMMWAVFDANPEAFGDDVDMLYAGALLRIPSAEAILQPDPVFEMASSGSSVATSEFTTLLGESRR